MIEEQNRFAMAQVKMLQLFDFYIILDKRWANTANFCVAHVSSNRIIKKLIKFYKNRISTILY